MVGDRVWLSFHSFCSRCPYPSLSLRRGAGTARWILESANLGVLGVPESWNCGAGRSPRHQVSQTSQGRDETTEAQGENQLSLSEWGGPQLASP